MEYYEVRIRLPKPSSRWFRFGTRTLLGAMTLVCVVMTVVAWRAARSQAVADVVPILGPITSGGPIRALGAPSDDEVMRALERVKHVRSGVPRVFKRRRDQVRIVKSKTADYVDPVRTYPMIGPAQQHHAHYKCTIYYKDVQRIGPFTVRSEDVREVVHIDHNHLHLVASEQHQGGVGEE